MSKIKPIAGGNSGGSDPGVPIVVIGAGAETFLSRFIPALRSSGFHVTLAADAGELFGVLATHNGGVRSVLFDTSLAGHDCGPLIRGIRSTHADIPVIAAAANPEPRVIVDAIRSGATGFVTPPLSAERLLDLINAPHKQGVAPGCGGETRPENVVIAVNPRMRAISAAIRQIAVSDVPVIIEGESGVGKEVLAREIHAVSPRKSKPFVKINCAAVPADLLESELFGYERGAFTGAVTRTSGKLEAADGGTVLLDEIGDMDVRLQAKLLHFLQDQSFQRLGGNRPIHVNVRILAATNQNLERAIAERSFREDLFYRLNVISLHVPPLRERRDEILPLAAHLLEKHGGGALPLPGITAPLARALLAHAWPGNVRELENVMRRFLVFRDPDSLIEELRGTAPLTPAQDEVEVPARRACTLRQLRDREEASRIRAALADAQWHRVKAAQMLGIEYRSLIYRMKKLGVG